MTDDAGITTPITYPIITCDTTYPIITCEIERYVSPQRNEIYTVEDLKNIKNDLTADYYLMVDLDLNEEEWTPLGSYGAGYIGTFYGQGHTISNLTINKNNNDHLGLFSAIGRQIPRANGSIQNLYLSNVNIETSGSQVASLVGNILGGSTVIGCAVNNFRIIGGSDVGGLISEISNEGSASQSYAANGYIYSTGENAGGFVANNCIHVDNCYSYNCVVYADVGFGGHFGGYCVGEHINCWSWSPHWITSFDSYAFCGLCDSSKTINCLAFGGPQDPVGHGVNSWEEEDIQYLCVDIDPFTTYNYNTELWKCNVPNGMLLKIFDE